MTALPQRVVAWYGDDFTGAAAVMEVLEFAGLSAVLFLDLPSEAQLARFPQARAIGVAGDARARPPAWMRATLPALFDGLRALDAALLHYKICSTLDSAPDVGSIGVAADTAGGWAAMVVAAPEIGRWQAFGTLFAQAGGDVVRLDRHPTMRHHPVTPMNEADVRRHLAHQTDRPIGLVDLLDLKAGQGQQALARARAAGAEIVAFDVIDAETLGEAGRVIWEARPPLVIGSQGVEYALIAAWRADGLLGPPRTASPLAPSARICVVSGSCAPATAAQIAAAQAAGFDVVDVDVTADWAGECDRAAATAIAALEAGRSVIVATARGPVDTPRATEAFNANIGSGLGRVLDRVLHETGVGRGVIAGGDTSSHGARELRIHALTAVSAAAPGAALLRGWSDDPRRDGIELALKGGQMGPPDFFVQMRDGAPAPV